MVYTPPTRAEMREVIYRALRDPAGSVFPPDTVNDFINEALMDLSNYRPREESRVVVWNEDTETISPEDVEGMSDIWAVQVRVGYADTISASNSGGRSTFYIPPMAYGASNVTAGWEMWGPSFRLTNFWVQRIKALRERTDVTLLMFGYADRLLPVEDIDYLDLSNPTDQFCLTQHAKMLGFQTLNADRSLYQQWLSATNNTDVSPTQLQGMLGQAEASFQRIRGRNSVIRRVPVTSYVSGF